MNSRLLSSKMSPLAKYGMGTFTPAAMGSNDQLYGVETTDTYQREDDPILETMNLPVRLHHSKLEVFPRLLALFSNVV